MKTFHRICESISGIAILNFLLFFVIAWLIGGDAVNGKAEGGHYYLANHGQLTEVSYFVYMYSKLHVYSVFITLPLVVLASLLYWLTGGGSTRPKAQATNVFQPKNHFGQVFKALLWQVTDLLAGLFWLFFDAWRKPDYEKFVRLSQAECIQALRAATDQEPAWHDLKQPLWGYFSGNYFYLEKWRYNPYVRDGGLRCVVSGKLSATRVGTYVRAWHRFKTVGIMFLILWFGTVLSGLSLYLLFFINRIEERHLSVAPLLIVPTFYLGTWIISIRLGAWWGKQKNRDLLKFIHSVLFPPQSHQHTSSSLPHPLKDTEVATLSSEESRNNKHSTSWRGWKVRLLLLLVPLLCSVVVLFPRLFTTVKAPSLPDYLWALRVNHTLQEKGYSVHAVSISESEDADFRDIDAQVGNWVNGEPQRAYSIVKDIHAVIAQTFPHASWQPKPVDFVSILLIDYEHGSYFVGVAFETAQKFQAGELSESAYFAQWSYPDELLGITPP